MGFADNLKQLPAISHLAELQLIDASGVVVATIENKPGQTGSLAVYNHLAQLYGAITADAADFGTSSGNVRLLAPTVSLQNAITASSGTQ